MIILIPSKPLDDNKTETYLFYSKGIIVSDNKAHIEIHECIISDSLKQNRYCRNLFNSAGTISQLTLLGNIFFYVLHMFKLFVAQKPSILQSMN